MNVGRGKENKNSARRVVLLNDVGEIIRSWAELGGFLFSRSIEGYHKIYLYDRKSGNIYVCTQQRRGFFFVTSLRVIAT